MALGLGMVTCTNGQQPAKLTFDNASISVGAERMSVYLPLLKGKRVALVTNQTGMVGQRHLVDTLLSSGVQVVKVFAPEHGFRGTADAGATVKDGRDERSGLPVLSLYGDQKKPTTAQLKEVDLLVFDIQDVGVRFYTYIGTMHYVMESAAENGIPLLILDRPNPNGWYVDGPVLDMAHRSFVGMHPVPLVHGMTVGEFAQMINGEGWLKGGVVCDLTVIPCEGYEHGLFYELPVRPSPNLPNMSAIYLYPSLGFFEGTIVSVGRGTDKPFQCIGYPGCPVGSFRFTPVPMPGAKDPPYKGQECRGVDLSEFGTFYPRSTGRVQLGWLLGMFEQAADRKSFFTPFFDKLAGGPALREQIQAGWDEERIRAGWHEGLAAFQARRAPYLLYP